MNIRHEDIIYAYPGYVSSFIDDYASAYVVDGMHSQGRPRSDPHDSKGGGVPDFDSDLISIPPERGLI